MNYQHQYHAGNAPDCFKHLSLVLALQHLLRKDAPLFYLDTHAGAGKYALQAGGEHESGISRLWSRRRELGALRPWLDLLSGGAVDGHLAQYPGSPLLAARLLRPEDHLVVCESQAVPWRSLREELQGRSRTSVLQEDGYGCLHAHLPPVEGRGLVLLDPPYEAPDEWERLGDALVTAQRRWPQGVFLVWYPVKIRGRITRLWQALRPHFGFEIVELLQAPEEGRDRLIGSGLLMVRPPWGLREQLAAALSQMGPELSEPDGRGFWSLRMAAFPKLAATDPAFHGQQRLGGKTVPDTRKKGRS